MIYYLLIVLIIIFLIVIVIDKDLFSPAAMICESYILAVFCASLNIRQWNIHLSSTTFMIIIVGIISFVLPSIIIGHISTKKIEKNDTREENDFRFNKQIYILLVLLQVATIFLYFYFVYKTVGNIGSLFNLMKTYRDGVAYGDLESQVPTIVNQLFKVSQIVGFMSFYYIIYNRLIMKRNNKLLPLNILSVLLFIIVSLLSGGRYRMVAFILGCIVLWYLLMNSKKAIKTNIRLIIRLSIIILAIMLVFSNTRRIVGRDNSSSFIYYVSSYFGGSIESLDLYIENPSPKSNIIGKETFYGINRTLSKFGIVESYSPNLEFRKSNNIYIGNVYTAFRVYLHDFGLRGVIILQILLAIFWTSWYKKIKKRKALNFDNSIFFYSMFVSCLWLSSYTDSFYSSVVSLSTITTIIYYLIIKKVMVINNIEKKSDII